jgi:Tat protein translocase TatB subunit
MDFFGIGFGELVLILLVALIIFGPGRLPEVARTLGRLSRNLKKMSSDLTTAVTTEMGLEEERETLKKASSDLTSVLTKQIILDEETRGHLGADKTHQGPPSKLPSGPQSSEPARVPPGPAPEAH